ncbi:MAG: hypothetical protein ACJ786_20580 [Catenulispora sp.]
MRRRAAGDLVFLAAVIIAIILILHIIFVLLDANPNNDIVRTDADWAGWLATWFKDLFTPSNPKLNVFLNYGLATLVFLAIGGILRRVLNDALA